MRCRSGISFVLRSSCTQERQKEAPPEFRYGAIADEADWTGATGGRPRSCSVLLHCHPLKLADGSGLAAESDLGWTGRSAASEHRWGPGHCRRGPGRRAEVMQGTARPNGINGFHADLDAMGRATAGGRQGPLSCSWPLRRPPKRHYSSVYDTSPAAATRTRHEEQDGELYIDRSGTSRQQLPALGRQHHQPHSQQPQQQQQQGWLRSPGDFATFGTRK
jgi:hypothetical protein